MSDKRAVVLGASMAGLLAAKALSDNYGTVVVVERDVLPTTAANRRGVPQGSHAHGLQPQGAVILEKLFPGILAALVADGAPVWEDRDLSRIDFTIAGHPLQRTGRIRTPMKIFFPSRVMLEHHVRERVRETPNITVIDGHEIAEFTSTHAGDRITGARISNRDDAIEFDLAADLVVDATGRASRTPTLLTALGYARPPEQELAIRLSYASQLVRIPSEALNELAILVFPEPGRPTSLTFIKHDSDRWLLTIGALAGWKPPATFNEMILFAETFAPGYVIAALRAGEAIGGVKQHHVPSSRWRRYDRAGNLPGGLIVIGDAMCSFNPAYGQGMTVAAIEALVLAECSRSGDHGFEKRYFRAAAKQVGAAWQAAVGADLALPEIEGRRSMSLRANNAYLSRLLSAAESDPRVTEQFLRVIGMVDSPAHLFRPGILRRVAWSRCRRATSPIKPHTAPVRH
jgi:2-polyprenyl-6-methoxyphenol hydroxylase-like FAD-dependent oxidoreductase